MPVTIFQYSNGDAGPETWTTETSWFSIKYVDSIDKRLRTLTISVSDPRNLKSSTYTQYLRVRLYERTSGNVIFLGRVIKSNPDYEVSYGQVLQLECADYAEELFERKVNSDYSGYSWKRSQIIAQLVTDYTYAGALTQNIEASGSSETLSRNFTKNDQAPASLIEALAQEDWWTDETWGAAWRYNGATFDNNTTEANSTGGTPFDFLDGTTHYFYIGQNNPFVGASFTLNSNGAYGAQTWEYWDGDSWNALTLTKTYDFTSASGEINWNIPSSWASAILPGSPPDATSRFWARVKVASVTTKATVNKITCIRGCGYDFIVDNSQVFHYFRRGSKPTGGPTSGGLTVGLGVAEAVSTRSMMADYSFSNQPKEINTRVTCRGTDVDGATQSYTATNTTLETTLGIIKEKVDYVWGSEMSAATLLAYVTTRAKALLSASGGSIVRGDFSIARYPFYGVAKTLVRVGDLIHITISPKSIDTDFIVLEVIYREPEGIARIKVVSTVYGRSLSDLSSVLDGLTSGKDVVTPTSRMQDLIVGNARIANLAAEKITTGYLSADRIEAGTIAATKLTFTPYVVGVNTIDDIADGVSFQKTSVAALDANGLVIMSEITGTLDDVDNGTNFKKTASAALDSNGLVLLDSTIEGTYALVKQTIISAGFIQVADGTHNQKDTLSATVGLRGINISNTEMVGQYDGVDQFKIGIDGKIASGNSNVVIGYNVTDAVYELALTGASLRAFTGTTKVGVIDGNASGFYITASSSTAGKEDLVLTSLYGEVILSADNTSIDNLRTAITDATSGKALDTAYQNTAGCPIEVCITLTFTPGDVVHLAMGTDSSCADILCASLGDTGSTTSFNTLTKIVPAGWYYMVVDDYGTPPISYWIVTKLGL